MNHDFQVGDKVKIKETTRGMMGRVPGVVYLVMQVHPERLDRPGSVMLSNRAGSNWYAFSEVTLWDREPLFPKPSPEADPVQDATRGVFVSVELDGDMSAEFNVKVYADALSALKDSNGTRREVFFVPYPTIKAESPVWEEVR